ncbi:unnamed protein product [Phaedon cochleariae]|uniref:Uncharacterized protein n=1 Tax=Phaedon cochleariae TaxID=80249 RepID=A0A9P0GJV9_PHACE|nr:unnamed protein product [Phaedon cochleariae]
MSIRSHTNCKTFHFIIVSAFVVLIRNTVSESDILFRNGWYKDDDDGPKYTISNVPYIDSKVVPDSKYLQIKSRITTLYNGSVNNLLNVRTFKLVSCEILSIKSGAFLNLPNLTTLALNDNEIEHINNGVFNHLTIMRLFLHRNNIQSIDTEAFDNMPYLYMLKLNSNKLTMLDPNWFKKSPQLTDLYLRRNEITNIPSGAFKNIKGSHNINGTETVDTKIFLSKNSINFIHPNAFQGLERLNQLWLDRNELKHIEEMVFAGLDYVGVIFLSKNKLTGLPKNILSSLKMDLMTLDLAGNKNVSCLDYEIISRVKITNLEKIHKLDCHCIDFLIRKLIEGGEDNEIKTDCEKDRTR